MTHVFTVQTFIDMQFTHIVYIEMVDVHTQILAIHKFFIFILSTLFTSCLYMYYAYSLIALPLHPACHIY